MIQEWIMKEIWSRGGEPSDIDPTSDTSYNGSPLLSWVANEGQRAVSSYKDPRTKRIFRLRTLISEMYFQSKVIEGTLTGDGTDSTIVFPSADVGTDDDRYNGWVAEVNSEIKLLTDYTGSTYTGKVHSDWGTAPATDDTYKLYKRFSTLMESSEDWVLDHITLPSTSTKARAEGNLIEVLKITDLANERIIKRAGRTEDFTNKLFSNGDPLGWFRKGNNLIFDTNINEENWYKLEYYRMPKDMASSSEIPEIPEYLHEGIILWGVEWIFARRGESSLKWSAKGDFRDFMAKTISTYEIQFERDEDSGSLQME